MAHKFQEYLADETVQKIFKPNFSEPRTETVGLKKTSSNRQRLRINFQVDTTILLRKSNADESCKNKSEEIISQHKDSKLNDYNTGHIMVNVKRILFKEAEDLHNNNYMKSLALSFFERKRMCLGLSELLGLINQQSQRKLFDTAT